MHIQHEGWPIYLQNERSQLLALQNDGGSPRISKDRHENQSCWTGTLLTKLSAQVSPLQNDGGSHLLKLMSQVVAYRRDSGGNKKRWKNQVLEPAFFLFNHKAKYSSSVNFFLQIRTDGFLGFNLTWRTEDVLSFEPPVRLLKFRPCETDVAQKPTSRCKSGVGDADRLLIAACVALATGAHPGEVLGYARTERKMDDNGEAFNLACLHPLENGLQQVNTNQSWLVHIVGNILKPLSLSPLSRISKGSTSVSSNSGFPFLRSWHFHFFPLLTGGSISGVSTAGLFPAAVKTLSFVLGWPKLTGRILFALRLSPFSFSFSGVGLFWSDNFCFLGFFLGVVISGPLTPELPCPGCESAEATSSGKSLCNPIVWNATRHINSLDCSIQALLRSSEASCRHENTKRIKKIQKMQHAVTDGLSTKCRVTSPCPTNWWGPPRAPKDIEGSSWKPKLLNREMLTKLSAQVSPLQNDGGSHLLKLMSQVVAYRRDSGGNKKRWKNQVLEPAFFLFNHKAKYSSSVNFFLQIRTDGFLGFKNALTWAKMDPREWHDIRIHKMCFFLSFFFLLLYWSGCTIQHTHCTWTKHPDVEQWLSACRTGMFARQDRLGGQESTTTNNCHPQVRPWETDPCQSRGQWIFFCSRDSNCSLKEALRASPPESKSSLSSSNFLSVDAIRFSSFPWVGGTTSSHTDPICCRVQIGM